MEIETHVFWMLLSFGILGLSGFYLAAVVATSFWVNAKLYRKLDSRLEALREKILRDESTLTSEPGTREMESVWLQHRLSARSEREMIFSQRRMKAAERVWTKTSVGLRGVASIATTASIIGFSGATARVAIDEPIRDYLDNIVGTVQENDLTTADIDAERLYVNELVWAFFSAYQTVLHFAYLQLKVITIGIRAAHNTVKIDAAVDMIKAALPHQTDFLEKNPEGVFLLVNELRENVFIAIRKMLQGNDLEADEIARASTVLSAVRRAQDEADRAKAVTLKTW